MQDDILLEPKKAYTSVYKDKHKENTEKFFEELTEAAQTDVEANRKTIKEYKEVLDEIKVVNKKLGNQKTLKTILILLMIVSIIALIIVAYQSFSTGGVPIPIWAGVISVVGVVLILVGGIILIKKVIQAKIKALQAKLEELNKKAKTLENTAWAQMATLNALFDWGMPAKIVSQTVPLIEMDTNFDPKKYSYLHDKYGFGEIGGTSISTDFVQSGSILGNPFLILRTFNQTWYNKVYTGSITIHWTTTVRDKDGRSRTVHHSQTLTASVSKPAPAYNYKTQLIYGNDAAPKLSFSRAPSGASGLSEKQIDQMVKKATKKLEKKAKKAVTSGESYTRLGNDEFEVLYGGTDRDNEIEFRLLFTPLAQRNMLALIKENEPYGDDFHQAKKKCLNYIESRHSQAFDYYARPTTFVGFDYDAVKAKFISYNVDYFKGFYFDMAPLLSIPLYQQTKTKEYIYGDDYPSNVTSYEHESIANSFNASFFKPAGSSTPSILKANFRKKDDIFDTVAVEAHAYRTERRVTYIKKFGGDGRTHTIPVYWLEYLPITKTTMMGIEPKNSSRPEYTSMFSNPAFNAAVNKFAGSGGTMYERGLFAAILTREITREVVSELNSVFVGSVATAAKAAGTMAASTEELIKSILLEKALYDDVDAAQVEDKSQDILTDDKAETKEVDASEVDVVDDEAKEKEAPEEDDDDDDDEDEE